MEGVGGGKWRKGRRGRLGRGPGATRGRRPRWTAKDGRGPKSQSAAWVSLPPLALSHISALTGTNQAWGKAEPPPHSTLVWNPTGDLSPWGHGDQQFLLPQGQSPFKSKAESLPHRDPAPHPWPWVDRVTSTCLPFPNESLPHSEIPASNQPLRAPGIRPPACTDSPCSIQK